MAILVGNGRAARPPGTRRGERRTLRAAGPRGWFPKRFAVEGAFVSVFIISWYNWSLSSLIIFFVLVFLVSCFFFPSVSRFCFSFFFPLSAYFRLLDLGSQRVGAFRGPLLYIYMIRKRFESHTHELWFCIFTNSMPDTPWYIRSILEAYRIPQHLMQQSSLDEFLRTMGGKHYTINSTHY